MSSLDPSGNETPVITTTGKPFPIPADTGAPGNTIPDKYASSGVKIPTGYDPPGPKVIE